MQLTYMKVQGNPSPRAFLKNTTQAMGNMRLGIYKKSSMRSEMLIFP